MFTHILCSYIPRNGFTSLQFIFSLLQAVEKIIPILRKPGNVFRFCAVICIGYSL